MFNIIKKLLKYIRLVAIENATFYLKEDLFARKSLLGIMFLPWITGLPIPPMLALDLLPYSENEILIALRRYSPSPDSFSFLSGLIDGVL